MDDPKAARFRASLLEWARTNLREFPWRSLDASLYEVFLAEFFLARTRSEVVSRVYPKLLEAYPSMDALRNTNRDDLVDVIRPMGFQNRRADALLEIAEMTDGSLPKCLNEMLQLPQVGRYGANATLCFALDYQLPIVDRNVERIYGRLFGVEWEALSEEEKWDVATELLPPSEARTYNVALLDFASAVCTAREPNCGACFATDYCRYSATTVRT